LSADPPDSASRVMARNLHTELTVDVVSGGESVHRDDHFKEALTERYLVRGEARMKAYYLLMALAASFAAVAIRSQPQDEQPQEDEMNAEVDGYDPNGSSDPNGMESWFI